VPAIHNTMSGPIPSTLVLLSDLPNCAQGQKVRFLGWYVLYICRYRSYLQYEASTNMSFRPRPSISSMPILRLTPRRSLT
jgi:hypothetical protein